jgi:xylitol oxidase
MQTAHPGTPQLTNWAGNVTFMPSAFHTPESLDELRRVVATSRELRALGTGHSFSPIADTAGDLVNLARMPTRMEVAEDGATVTVSAGTRYGELAQALHERGLALHNLGSLPHIAVAGACATGTHGSGDTNQALAGAVRGLELVTATGDLVTLTGDDVHAATVALGLLGVVTAVTLAVEPGYELWQLVYDDLPEEAALEHLDDLFAAAYSVSLFSTWKPGTVDQLWLKGRTSTAMPGADLFGARLADGPRHPIAGVPPLFTTEQGGIPGPWFERLPHFKLEFTPSAGEELQSEYLLPRAEAAAAIAELGAIRERFAHLVQVSEFRSVAADDLWLSPAYGRESVAIHFTWVKDQGAVSAVLPEVEAVLMPHGARPHWGKVFTVAPQNVRDRYPRWAEFAALADSYDPRGVFRNPMLSPYFG